MKTKEILAKLRSMAGEAGEAVFKRVAMIREVLEDREFVAAEFGDWETARDVLHQECFPDLSMAVTLDQLLTLYRWFPDVGKWREHKFNLRRLWAQYVEEDSKLKREEKRQEVRQRHPTKEEYEQQKQDMQLLSTLSKRKDAVIDEKDRRIGELVQENVDLKNQIALLKKENASLRRRLEKLETQTPTQEEAAVA